MTIVSENPLTEDFQLVEAYGRIQLIVAPCLRENGKSVNLEKKIKIL